MIERSAVYPDSTDLERRIRALRELGQLSEAIALCKGAAERNPGSLFYPKILGDLYFQQGDYDSASDSYLDFLVRLPAGVQLFGDFAKRYHRLKRAWPKERLSAYAGRIMTEIQHRRLNEQIATRASALIMSDLPSKYPREVTISAEGEKFIELLDDDSNFQPFVRSAKRLEAQNQSELVDLLDHKVLDRVRTDKTFRVDMFCISIYEKAERHESALKLSEELLSVRRDPTMIRSFFRLSRKSGSYKRANNLLAMYPEILRQEVFPVLYELVYYFEAENRFDEVRVTLEKMERLFRHSAPIQKTLRNFYIRFGMVDDARRVEQGISNIESSRTRGAAKFSDAVQESESEMYSELEHQRQLAAISDLTTGISHELGQPITNIRYTLQFHRRLFERAISKEAVFEVFDSVLEETERMGGLIKRLSPITSSRNVVERFDVIDRIRKRVQAESIRLRPAAIAVDISPSVPVCLNGDPVKFDQLISNLLLNSLDSITESGRRGNNRIDIRAQDQTQEIRITFSDNGTGIPAKYRGKIFDPFFSTKAPGKGEGLGLFIVWNLLKMQGGTIALDPKFPRGARFIINIPKGIPARRAGSSNEEQRFVS
jgi:signal transduction histidine kinase